MAEKELFEMEEGSVEEFICEHYWGFNKADNAKTFYYGVEHPKWKTYKTIESTVDVDFEDVYGMKFRFLKNEIPSSLFLAEGSTVIVREGQALN